jgi:hypothetical protein
VGTVELAIPGFVRRPIFELLEVQCGVSTRDGGVLAQIDQFSAVIRAVAIVAVGLVGARGRAARAGPYQN